MNQQIKKELLIQKIIKIIANESGINAQRTSMDLPIIKRLLQLYKRQLKTK
jgi:hypothetical protein